VVASEAIAPYRKDVLAKCYGGDISRKKKLLQKQVSPRVTGLSFDSRPRLVRSSRLRGECRHSHTNTPPTNPPPTAPTHTTIYTTHQADGKKRMKQLGKVEVPQAAFMAVLKINQDE
jgi:hypothetical protein